MPTLTLDQASTIIDAALAHARTQKLAPLAVAVLDAGGHLLAFKREDNAAFLRIDLAYGKAWGALGMGYGTQELARRADMYPTFFTAVAIASGGRIVPSHGGVLILGTDGQILGAVGVSGDAGENDEGCALAGIQAAGLRARPGDEKTEVG